ncbi:MAG: T9SS type A sorting domain-containing protein [Candidatus Kapaibacterium sp.]
MKQKFLFTKLTFAIIAYCFCSFKATSQNFRLTSGDAHFGALIDQNYIVQTWGDNHFGQLGDSTSISRDYMYPVFKGAYNGSAFLGDNNSNRVFSISIAEFHGLALTEKGEVFSWGNNGNGRLGVNSTSDKWLPVRVLKGDYPGTNYLGDDSLNKIISVIAYGDASYALSELGEVYSWGFNSEGQLGTGDVIEYHSPKRVLKGTYPGTNFLGDAASNKIIQIAAGSNSGYALTSNGLVYSWGTNYNGELGDGTDTSRLTPVQVISGAYGGNIFLGDDTTDKVVKIFASENNAFVLTSKHKLFAWGYNFYGTLGDNTMVNKNYPMRPLAGDYPGTYIGDSPSDFIVQVAGGRAHTLFLTLSGKVYATGWNPGGQLGNGTTSNRELPVQVRSGTYQGSAFLGELLSNPILTIGTGYASSYAIDKHGEVYSWGGDDYPRPKFNILISGALGDCNSAINQVRPVNVKDGSCNDVLLPVELTLFTAEAINKNNIKINWKTASESNCAYFELSRKTKLENEWGIIQLVKGSGSTSTPHNYELQDDITLAENDNIIDYKLVEITIDGSKRHIASCRVNLANVNNSMTELYQANPNPANSETSINYSILEDGLVKIFLFDVNGKHISTLFEGYEKVGKHSQNVSLTDIQSGTYNIRFISNGIILNKILKVIK